MQFKKILDKILLENAGLVQLSKYAKNHLTVQFELCGM